MPLLVSNSFLKAYVWLLKRNQILGKKPQKTNTCKVLKEEIGGSFFYFNVMLYKVLFLAFYSVIYQVLRYPTCFSQHLEELALL